MNFLKSIGASFNIGMDGMPTVDIIYSHSSQNFASVQEIFTFLNRLNLPIVFAIDEFQEIKKYSNHMPFEDKLKSLTQQSDNINFLYSGSEHHL